MYISSDTNVWIDFSEIGQLSIPFKLGYQYFISRYTFIDEFIKPETMKDDLLQYGLQLADISEEEYADAVLFQSKYCRLSLYDSFALSIAKNRGWILLSGDKPLRDAAIVEGVECHGTIWVCDRLKTESIVTENEYMTIIDSFIKAVDSGKCRLPMNELQKRKEQTDK